MSVPVKQCTFAGGEITSAAWARSDLALYEKSARTLRNMICMKHGGATGRPGTMYVGTALNGGNPVRLIPFIFNETGLGQSYVLEFGNQYIAFYQNGGVVISGGNPYTIASPYLQADLALLDFRESADIITITHQNYAPMELARFGPTNWVLSTIAFGAKSQLISFISMSGVAGSNQYIYLITSVLANGDEGTQSNSATEAAASVSPPDPTHPISMSWYGPTNPPLAGIQAITYNIYRAQETATALGAYGFVGSVPAPAPHTPATVVTFADTVITPDYTHAPPQTSPFESQMGAGNYPATVGFAQQRRYFARTANNPIGFWGSKPGSFYNYDVRLNTPDDDPIIAQVAGEEVNQIQFLLELKFMLMLTAGAEIYVQGNGSGVVTPSAINASTQSQFGCSTLRPIKAGDVLIFSQALGSKIRDFAFDFAIDGYRGNDISIFASHLFEGYTIVDWCYQKEPDSIIWAVRSDGVLLSCTYIREQQVLAWTHHDMVNGFVENVCAIPENGAYAVYASVRRFISGTYVRYIERLSSRIWQGPQIAINLLGTASALGDPIDSTYLDCFSGFDGRNIYPSRFMTLTASGAFVTDGTAYQQQLTLTCSGFQSSTFFNSNMVGDQIFLEDAEYISSQGASGNIIRCAIQTYTSPTVVTVTPDAAVPVEFQAAQIASWAWATARLSGLLYLQGQQVSVWADRFVVGSPLNSHYSTAYTIPSNGKIVLDKPYSVIKIGLPMIQDVETLDLETYFGETILGRRKRMAGLYGYLYQTRSFYAGSENPDTNQQNVNDDPLFQMFPLRTGHNQVTLDQPPPLLTSQDYLITNARWGKRGSIFMRNLDPLPWTLLAVSPKEEDAVTTPYKRV